MAVIIRRIFLTIWTLLLLLALSGISWYVYLISTGQQPTLYQPKDQADKNAVAENPEAEIKHYSLPKGASEEFVEMMGLGTVDPATYVKDPGHYLFRTQSGNVVCAISTDSTAVGSDWFVPLAGDQKPAPGIICGSNLPVPLTGDLPSCKEGNLSGETFAITPERVVAGGCLTGQSRLRLDTGTGPVPGPEERLKIPALEYGARLQVDRYACTDDGEELTCGDIPTGRGFSLDYESFREIPKAS